ncbi:transposase [Streptomyces sp. NPDC007369]|uniref:transposase n=1 Tax=Streptomyces sp. NPDC007369 TaxID=3154589 RepID=UPI00340D0819
MADAGYGQMHAFRAALADRGVDYVVAVRGDTSAHPGDAVPTAPKREGRMGPRGCPATASRPAP